MDISSNREMNYCYREQQAIILRKNSSALVNDMDKLMQFINKIIPKAIQMHRRLK
jgi:hypothetical protein